jgi:hypothetical protein
MHVLQPTWPTISIHMQRCRQSAATTASSGGPSPPHPCRLTLRGPASSLALRGRTLRLHSRAAISANSQTSSPDTTIPLRPASCTRHLPYLVRCIMTSFSSNARHWRYLQQCFSFEHFCHRLNFGLSKSHISKVGGIRNAPTYCFRSLIFRPFELTSWN